MEMTKDISLELFQTLLNTIKKNGYESTLKMLKTTSNEIEIDDETILQVVQIVCDEFTLDVNDLIYDRYVRGEHKYAIGFCLYYLYQDYSLGDLQKKGLFKYKDKSVLSRYRQLIDKLDSKHKADMPYLKIKDKLDKKIYEIKK
jgi:hypothetical protein